MAACYRRGEHDAGEYSIGTEVSKESCMNLANAVVFVTGANRGIGLATVRELVSRGAKKVYAASRSGELPGSFDAEVVPVRLDVSMAESIQAAVQAASDVNVLINNAGVLDFGDILSVSQETLDRDLAVNFFGMLNTTKAFVPRIEANGGGTVVNILTLLSFVSAPGMAAYNVSKAAAWSASLSLRASLASRGVRIQNVFPGAIDTDMLAGVDIAKTSPAEAAENIVRGLESGSEDIFPDSMSKSVYEQWRQDHKAVEKAFASM